VDLVVEGRRDVRLACKIGLLGSGIVATCWFAIKKTDGIRIKQIAGAENKCGHLTVLNVILG
jgi:hypothetical protein